MVKETGEKCGSCDCDETDLNKECKVELKKNKKELKEKLIDMGISVPIELKKNLKVKKLDNFPKNSELKYQTSGSNGIDLFAAIDKPIKIKAHATITIPCGVCIKIPDGYVGLLCPRSGLAKKYGITVLNSPGIADSDYIGEYAAILYNSSSNPYVVNPGDRIMQLVVVPSPQFEIQYVEELEETERGGNGFGSTGK